MRVFQAFLPIFFISLFINNSVIAADKMTVDVATTHTIDSSILKEQRRLLIHLPENYETSDKTYPVVYALDGSGHIHHAAVATYMLSRYERIPETIVVAITNNRETRSRDLGDERENFKRFIKEEVISFVNKNYRTSESKTLFGHSRAGFFTLDVLATEPDMFDYYIAASPAIGVESSVFPKLVKMFEGNTSLTKKLYFSLGNKNAEGENADIALNNLVNLLKDNAPPRLNWHYQPMPFQVHMTTPYLTLYDGLSFVFND